MIVDTHKALFSNLPYMFDLSEDSIFNLEYKS